MSFYIILFSSIFTVNFSFWFCLRVFFFSHSHMLLVHEASCWVLYNNITFTSIIVLKLHYSYEFHILPTFNILQSLRQNPFIFTCIFFKWNILIFVRHALIICHFYYVLLSLWIPSTMLVIGILSYFFF